MKKRIITWLIAVTVITGLTAGCGSSDTGTADSTKAAADSTEAAADSTEVADSTEAAEATGSAADSVVLGYTGSNTPYTLVDNYYQILQENFGDDVSVSYERFESGPDGITATVSGDVNIYIGVGDLPVVTSGANGSEYELVSYYQSEPDTYFSVLADSGIASLADISGKKVGVALGTMSQYALQVRLADAGLSLDDIELVNLSGTDLVTAFSAGEVDVMVNHYTLTQSLLDSGEAVKIDEADPSLMWILANKDYAAENQETIARVLAYFGKVSAYVEENEEEIIPELAEYYEMEENTLRTALDKSDTTFIHEITEEDIQELEDVLQFAQENELVDNSYDINAYVNDAYVQEAKTLEE